MSCVSRILRDYVFWLKEQHFLVSVLILNAYLINPVLCIYYFSGILLFLPIITVIFDFLCTSAIDSPDSSMRLYAIMCVI